MAMIRFGEKGKLDPRASMGKSLTLEVASSAGSSIRSLALCTTSFYICEGIITEKRNIEKK
jgi:hypothetical protein